MQLKHLTNTHDPKDKETAKMEICLTYSETIDPNGREKAWQSHNLQKFLADQSRYHLQYLAGKIIGPPISWHDYNDEELLSNANLIPTGILDGKGTLLEQMKRFQATTPTRKDLISQKIVGIYIVEEAT